LESTVDWVGPGWWRDRDRGGVSSVSAASRGGVRCVGWEGKPPGQLIRWDTHPQESETRNTNSSVSWHHLSARVALCLSRAECAGGQMGERGRGDATRRDRTPARSRRGSAAVAASPVSCHCHCHAASQSSSLGDLRPQCRAARMMMMRRRATRGLPGGRMRTSRRTPRACGRRGGAVRWRAPSRTTRRPQGTTAAASPPSHLQRPPCSTAPDASLREDASA
jgi:hypothetical protein